MRVDSERLYEFVDWDWALPRIQEANQEDETPFVGPSGIISGLPPKVSKPSL
jgi:hypothetical protein